MSYQLRSSSLKFLANFFQLEYETYECADMVADVMPFNKQFTYAFLVLPAAEQLILYSTKILSIEWNHFIKTKKFKIS